LEIAYHIQPADVRKNFFCLLSRSRNKGAIFAFVFSIVPVTMIAVVLWDAWSNHRLDWWVLVIILFMFCPPLLVVTIISMHGMEQLYPKGPASPFSTTEMTPDFLCFTTRRMLDEELLLELVQVPWVVVRDVVWHEGGVVFLCSGRTSNNFIPKSAFATPQELELFANTACRYWEAAKQEIFISPQDETIWPPAPRPANSAEPGDGPEG